MTESNISIGDEDSSFTTEDEKDPIKVLEFSFNQDCSGIMIGTTDGYYVYEMKLGEVVPAVFNHEPHCRIVERLYSSSLVAVVSDLRNRILMINHFKKESNICCYTYQHPIVAVKLNRMRLCVIFENRIAIHKINDMELIHNIADAPSNEGGLCALSASENGENCFLAYPGLEEGSVAIFDAFHLFSVQSIQAHDSAIQCMAFNDKVDKLATASVKGTVVRVFAVNAKQRATNRLFEFRRGISRNVTVHSLAFTPHSVHGDFLLCSSNTSTVHVFKCGEGGPASLSVNQDPGASLLDMAWGYTSSVVTAVASHTKGMLPTEVSDMMAQERSFATAVLPLDGAVTRVGCTKKNVILVGTTEGMLYHYQFDPELGGECPLVKQNNFYTSDITSADFKRRYQNKSADESAVNIGKLHEYTAMEQWQDAYGLFQASGGEIDDDGVVIRHGPV